jgi:DNA-binding LacI/PurR family transcriptional regulator/serine phosphatase RsbU (regulator of sigma subunit)
LGLPKETELPGPAVPGELRPSLAPREDSRRSGKRVALLVNDVFSTYQATFRAAIERALRRHGYNLMVFMGREVGHVDPKERAQNAVYDWVSKEVVDGALILSGTIANFTGTGGMQALCDRLGGIPVFSIGLEIPGHGSVVLNNRRAQAGAVEHLARQHDRRRIAYISGPASNGEAEQRLAGYRDALASADLEFDERLIAFGRFNVPSGQEAMRAIVARGAPFDAVVAANDDMALGAMDVLREQGLGVPEEVLVVGFDDTPVARFASRSLTTVAQPIDAMAEASVDALVAAMGGRPENAQLSLDAHLMLRESCGCGYAAARPATSSRRPATGVTEYLERERGGWIDTLCPSGDASAAFWRGSWGPALLEALAGELARKDGSFLLALEGKADEIRSHQVPLEQLAVFLLRLQQRFDEGGFQGASHFDLEQLWMRARALVSSMTTRLEARNALDQVQGSVNLRYVTQQLSIAFDTRTLVAELERSLPELGVDLACVALYPAADHAVFRPLLALEEGAPTPVDPRPYSAPFLLPGDFPRASEWSLLVWAITFESDVLGVVAVSGRAPPVIGESLRAQLGATLRMGALHARVVEQTAFQERLAREQLAQEMAIAQRIQTALAPKDLAVPSLAIAARSTPADEIGGDYYDVIPVDGGCWIGIGDVAGHGLMSGLVMLMIQSIVSTLVAGAPDASPSRLVIDVNRVLVPNLHKRLRRDEHATFALLRFFEGGRVRFAGAHEEIVVWRAASGRCESIATEGTWLGLVEDIAAATWDKELELHAGDLLVLVTDGILESSNARNELFGMDAVMRIVEAHGRSAPEVVVDELMSAVRAWAPRQRDDMTCVAARYEGAGSPV